MKFNLNLIIYTTSVENNYFKILACNSLLKTKICKNRSAYGGTSLTVFLPTL